jgi:hypothetical protein
MFCAVILSSLLLSATPAADLAEARAAEADLDYPRARTLIVGLLNRTDISDRELLEAHYLSGQIERILGNDIEARRHFLIVLSTQPEWSLAPDTPPKVRTFFEVVRTEVKERQRAEGEARRLELEAGKTTPTTLTSPGTAGPPSMGTIVAGGGAVLVGRLDGGRGRGPRWRWRCRPACHRRMISASLFHDLKSWTHRHGFLGGLTLIPLTRVEPDGDTWVS